MTDVAPGFAYRGDALQAEEVDLAGLAADVGTPFYCYAASAIEAAYHAFAEAISDLDAKVFYALKANSNQAVIATLARLGAGADVVSEGEMRRALAAGIPADAIIFAGVGKSAGEISAALEAGILQFNVESRAELERLSSQARQQGVVAPVALRINPDVDALTLKGISTGRAGDKFGIEIAQALEIARNIEAFPAVRLVGLAVHIGSLISDLGPCREAFARVAGLYREVASMVPTLRSLDLGGGLGIAYRGEPVLDLQDYAAIARETTAGLGAKLAFEPGRRLVGQAGILVTRVEYVKESGGRRCIVIDAAMNDLIRPMLYEAWHEIVPVVRSGVARFPADVVGPVCESTDTFARGRDLPPLKEGDLLAICSSGAYGAVMASTYNSRALVPEVMVRGAEYAVVRPRPTYDRLIALDSLPHWLAPMPDLRR
jgi:diaminopimelate decarboxylase